MIFRVKYEEIKIERVIQNPINEWRENRLIASSINFRIIDYLNDGFSAAAIGRETDIGNINIKCENRVGNNDDTQN